MCSRYRSRSNESDGRFTPLSQVNYGPFKGPSSYHRLCRWWLIPEWLSGPALDLYNLGLCPSPHWDGKRSPKGARKDQSSYFWDWSRYSTFGTHTEPEVGVLVV